MVLGTALQPTPFSDIPIEGEKLTFDQLNISFLVDEDLQNYQEIYSWLLSMGFPDNFTQFTSLKSPPVSSATDSIKSDMDIMIHTNKSRSTNTLTLYNNLPLLKNDTNNIIVYKNDLEEFKKKRKKRFWEKLISD